MRERALVLLSGGLDSATTLAVAKSEGFQVSALTFNYGQRHAQEIEFARKIVGAMKVREHRIININLREMGGSALTDDIEVPQGKGLPGREIPITYVPARNTIFLSYALGWAEVLRISDLFIGVNAIDYSGYPDCRPEYLRAFEKMANLATRAAVEGKKLKLHAPLVNLTKAEIISKGLSLGVDYSLTHSCYDPAPRGRACGRCHSCQLRRKGFREAGVNDPLDR